MKLGLGVDRNNFKEAQKTALMADKFGFHSIWTADHLTPSLESWTMMTALGTLTNRVKIGLGRCLIPTFRHPGVLANMAATLDIITNGRLILCLGAGWLKPEYEAYDIHWEEHDGRVEREREAILTMKALWTRNKANFDGTYYHLRGAMGTKPFQKPHPPIWICGTSQKTMEVAAEVADGWLLRGDSPEKQKERIEIMKRMVNGRPFEYAAPVIIYLGLPGEDKEELIRKLSRRSKRRELELNLGRALSKEELREANQASLNSLIVEQPDECVDRIVEYEKAGVDVLCIRSINNIELFAERVMPHIQSL